MSIFMSGHITGPHILVIQHSEKAPGAKFSEGLSKRGCRLTTLQPINGDALPENDADFDGLVVLGGPQSASDDAAAPHFRRLMEMILEFDRKKKPVAGICLGSQLLARAHGCNARGLGFLEIGFFQHQLTAAGKKDPVFHDIILPPLMGFHENTFDLPEEATLLVEGNDCQNQCFRVGNVSYGFQFHLEVDLMIARSWFDYFIRGEIAGYNKYLENFDDGVLRERIETLDEYITGSEQFCDRITERWLALVNQKHSLSTME